MGGMVLTLDNGTERVRYIVASSLEEEQRTLQQALKNEQVQHRPAWPRLFSIIKDRKGRR